MVAMIEPMRKFQKRKENGKYVLFYAKWYLALEDAVIFHILSKCL